MNRIKELRKSKNMTQTDLAKLLNVKQNTISNWESERTEIDKSSLLFMCDYFGVSVDYLLGRTDPTPETSNSDTPTDLEMPAELESVRMAFYGGPSNLSQKSLQDIAEYVKFIQERDKKEKREN